MIPTLIYQMCLLGNACNEQIIALKTQINTLNLKLQAQKEAMASLVNSISGGKQEQQIGETQNTATNIQTPNTADKRILRKTRKFKG